MAIPFCLRLISASGRLTLAVAVVLGSTARGEDDEPELAAPSPRPVAAVGILGTTTLRTDYVEQLQFSPDGTKLAGGSQASWRLWDTKSGELLLKYSPRRAGRVDSAPLCFLDGGRNLLSVNPQRGVMVCEWGRKPPLMLHYKKCLQPPYERLLATSTDGRRLLIVGGAAQNRSDQSLSVRDTDSGEILFELPSAERAATTISPSGKLVAFSKWPRDREPVGIEVWSVDEKRKLYSLGPFERGVDCMVFAPTDDVVYVTDAHGQVEAREIATNRVRRMLLPGGPDRTTSQLKLMSLSRDGRRLAVCAYRTPITVLDVEAGSVLRRFTWGLDRRALALALSSDGTLLAAGGEKYVTELWDVATGKSLFPTEGSKTNIFGLAPTPDGRSVAVLDQQRLLLWSPEGQIVAKRPSSGFSFGAYYDIGIGFTDEGRSLLSLMGRGKIEASDAQTLQPKFVVTRKTPLPTMLTMSAGLEATACVMSGNAVRFQPGPLYPPENLAADYRTHLGTQHRIRCLAFSHDGSWLICGDEQGEMAAWFTRRRARDREVRIPPTGKAITALAIRNDGQDAAVGTEDGSLRLWNLQTKRVDRSWSDLRWTPTALAFDPDQTRLAVGFGNGTLRIFDLATGNDVPLSAEARAVPDRIESVHRLAWSPAGDRLAVGFGTGRVWFLRVDAQSVPLETQEHFAPITALNWLRDGKQVASGDERSIVYVWDPDEAKPKQVLTGTLSPAVGIGIHPRYDKLTVYTRQGDVYCKQSPGGFAFTYQDHFDTLHLVDELDRFALAPDGRTMAASTETAVLVWNDLRAKETAEFPLTPGWGHNLEFSRDSKLLGIKEEGLSIRRVADGRQIVKIVPAETATAGNKSTWDEFHFSPVDDLVAVRRRREFKFVNVENGRLLRDWEIPINHVRQFAFTPDGAAIVFLGDPPKQELLLVEAVSGIVLHRLATWPNASSQFVLLNDGRGVVSADFTSLGVVWTLRPEVPNTTVATDAGQWEECWKDLASEDGGKAYRAIWRFSEAGDTAVDFLEKHVPTMKLGGESLLIRVQNAVQDLNNGEEHARLAMQRLAAMRPDADDELLWHLKNERSAEVKAKITAVLEADLRPATKEELRLIRTMHVLGRIGTAKAKSLLEKAASGPPESFVADSARSTLRFLAKKQHAPQ